MNIPSPIIGRKHEDLQTKPPPPAHRDRYSSHSVVLSDLRRPRQKGGCSFSLPIPSGSDCCSLKTLQVGGGCIFPLIFSFVPFYQSYLLSYMANLIIVWHKQAAALPSDLAELFWHPEYSKECLSDCFINSCTFCLCRGLETVGVYLLNPTRTHPWECYWAYPRNIWWTRLPHVQAWPRLSLHIWSDGHPNACRVEFQIKLCGLWDAKGHWIFRRRSYVEKRANSLVHFLFHPYFKGQWVRKNSYPITIKKQNYWCA